MNNLTAKLLTILKVISIPLLLVAQFSLTYVIVKGIQGEEFTHNFGIYTASINSGYLVVAGLGYAFIVLPIIRSQRPFSERTLKFLFAIENSLSQNSLLGSLVAMALLVWLQLPIAFVWLYLLIDIVFYATFPGFSATATKIKTASQFPLEDRKELARLLNRTNDIEEIKLLFEANKPFSALRKLCQIQSPFSIKTRAKVLALIAQPTE